MLIIYLAGKPPAIAENQTFWVQETIAFIYRVVNVCTIMISSSWLFRQRLRDVCLISAPVNIRVFRC